MSTSKTRKKITQVRSKSKAASPRARTTTIGERVRNERQDSFDEELETELEDNRLADLVGDLAPAPTRRPSSGIATSRSSSGSRPSW